MKPWLRIVVTCALASAAVIQSAAGQQARRERLTIGVVSDGPSERHGPLLALFREEILTLLSDDFDASMPKEKAIEGDWTLASVEAAVDSLLADDEVDLVLALGLLASHAAAGRRDLGKPVVAPVVIDPELQGLPVERGASGVPNLNYIALPQTPATDLTAFREIVPFQKVALLVNAPPHEEIEGLTARTEALLARLGFDAQVIPVGTSLQDALDALDGEDFDAVYLVPLFRLSNADFQRLVDALIERRLPSFSWLGEPEVRQGIMLGLKPASFFQRLARRVALNIQRIALGEDAGSLAVTFPPRERLTINMATVRAIGVYPPWKAITEAELIDEVRTEAARTVSLVSAAREAVETNLDLAAEMRVVAAGAREVRIASSTLLPQVEVSTLATIIDEDRAQASFGSQSQRALTGSATLSQLIFSEPAWANVSIQRSLQRSRELQRELLRLDIVVEATTAYLNVLRAKTFERIQRDNLRVTRSNLELAQVRQSVGAAGPGEVYRWENQIANNRRAVIDASASRNQAEIALNRLLHRPLEEPFLTEDADLGDPQLEPEEKSLVSYMQNPWSFKVLRSFMVSEALRSAPELRAIDALLEAQRRELSSAERSFWSPTLALQAGVSDVLARGGAGSEPGFGLPPGSGLDGLFPAIDDVSWSVGLDVSLPILSGGSRFALRGRAAEDVARLRIEREAAAERVEQRLRSAMHAMGASLASIDLSHEAAEAARRNFDVVADAYTQGAVNIIELLDAQNAALVADQVAANSVYDFLIDLMQVQRAAGRFDFFRTAEEREDFFQRLDAFMAAEGMPTGGR
jgi:outer membrane protein TolC